MIWLLAACTPTSAPAVVQTADTAAPYDPWADGLVGDPERGAGAFELRCATCHGAEGQGGLGPSLAPVVPTYTDLELYVLVTEGDGAMPKIGFDSPQEAVDVIAFLRQSFPD